MVAATAWTSSMMTVSTLSRVSRAFDVSIRYSDSGVVMRMSGGSRSSFCRSDDGVSPLRTPTVTSGGSSPSRRAVWVMPTRGLRRFRSTSTPSALSGETYSTRVRCLAGGWSVELISRSIDHRNDARVLPEPVGATTSACRPVEMASHAPDCAAVGAENAPRNHAAVAGEKRSRTSVMVRPILHATADNDPNDIGG